MFDKIKSLFVIEDEDGKTLKGTPTKNSASSPQKKTNPTTNNQAPTSPESSTTKGKVNEKFVNVLFGAMDKNNLDGFDYLEYKQSLRSLNKVGNMDEATKYKSAFAMAQTMGATPEKLVETAGHYIKVLKTEESKFAQALANQRAKQIGGKENAIKQTEATIQQKQQQIAQLQKEIEAQKKQVAAAQKEISGARLKVESTKLDFEVTYNKIVSQIMRDIDNMKKYLGK